MKIKSLYKVFILAALLWVALSSCTNSPYLAPEATTAATAQAQVAAQERTAAALERIAATLEDMKESREEQQEPPSMAATPDSELLEPGKITPNTLKGID